MPDEKKKESLSRRRCEWSRCEKSFLPRRKDQVYCSGGCRNAAWREEHPRGEVTDKCANCGHPIFTTKP